MCPKIMQARLITVSGQVQGVGFRPYVYRLALQNRLKGYVQNTPQGVCIFVQGEKEDLENFSQSLQDNAPPLAKILSLDSQEVQAEDNLDSFQIRQSFSGTKHQVLISPDTATCKECLQEIEDPNNRRYLYPFTNCTNCGPRFSITREIPYDRPNTSMSCFPMCPECLQEYQDPLNRRFHAQPNACANCGPQLWYQSEKVKETDSIKALRLAAQDLVQGKILALKGLGGFHLACSAQDKKAVQTLRHRKSRPHKPLALMFLEIDTAQKAVFIPDFAKELLAGAIRPILLLPKKENSPICHDIAPDSNVLGIMLPYTPLHYLLLKIYKEILSKNQLPALVMTSGNISNEPIILQNRQALKKLKPLADTFILHNRDILTRCDDSVLGVETVQKKFVFYRRARGYTPSPIHLGRKVPSVLGLGAESKVTVCFTKENLAYLSQHIGDLTNLANYEFYRQSIDFMQGILQVRPQLLVTDLHPDYLSTNFAKEQEKNIPSIRLQHHYAHIYSVLAENRYFGPALGLALDGTGLGEDQTLWGGELLFLDNQKNIQKRLGHFCQIKLPGGEAAIREPWRTTLSYLHCLQEEDIFKKSFSKDKSQTKALQMVKQMLDKDIYCQQSSSCGRLFDAVAALLGLKQEISYEGQAAIILESIQDRTEDKAYPCPVLKEPSPSVLDTLTLFEAVLSDWKKGIKPEVISRRFHLGLAQGLTAWTFASARELKLKTVALSGGVLQNLTLAGLLPELLSQKRLQVLTHLEVPPNDACISLGQAAYGGLLSGI